MDQTAPDKKVVDPPMLNLSNPLHVDLHDTLSKGCYTMVCTTIEVNGLRLEHWEIFYKAKGWFNKKKLLSIPIGIGKEYVSSWTSKDAAQNALKNYLITKLKYTATKLAGEQELNFNNDNGEYN